MTTWLCQKILMRSYHTLHNVRIYTRDKHCCLLARLSTSTEFEWIKPDGYDTGITLYNSLARTYVPLILRNKDLATWYACGPTVYDEMHIGHAYSYVQFDIIRRILEKYFHKNIVMVMGVTDIDDKIIARSRELNTTIQHITRHYEQEFFTDLGKLNVLPPNIIARVSHHIPEIIDFCDKIYKKGFAYSTPEGNLYFDVKKFGKFGKLSNMGILEDPGEIIDSAKQDSRDFALWKAVKPGEPWWEAPWGKGRPGWHIECSTMASCMFGSQLDIHSGGIDLIFPHHENEEKQCEVYHDTRQWANYWMHTGHLHLENDNKMAKSVGNTISVKSFLKDNLANEFRILCLRVPYRNGIEYSLETTNDCKAINRKIKEFLTDAESYVDGELKCSPIDEAHLMKCLNDARQSIHHCFQNDFDTAQALKEIIKLINEVNKNIKVDTKSNNRSRSPGVIAGCSSFVAKILGLLGVHYTSKKALLTTDTSAMLSSVMDTVVKFRSNVRLYALTTGSSSQPQYSISTSSMPISNEIRDSDESLPAPPVEPPSDKGDMIWTEKSLSAKGRIEIKRKEKEPLMKACDDIRNDLFIAGIQLKDRGRESSWSLLEDRTLEGKKSSLASHDAFDPSYTPRR